jgi:hypothetical protein
MMARDMAFLGRASDSVQRTSGVNTALSYGSVNFIVSDLTGLGNGRRPTYGLSDLIGSTDKPQSSLPIEYTTNNFPSYS